MAYPTKTPRCILPQILMINCQTNKQKRIHVPKNTYRRARTHTRARARTHTHTHMGQTCQTKMNTCANADTHIYVRTRAIPVEQIYIKSPKLAFLIVVGGTGKARLRFPLAATGRPRAANLVATGKGRTDPRLWCCQPPGGLHQAPPVACHFKESPALMH